MPYEPVHDCSQIDLGKHALIEASAGTGKTFTIENLVVRLLGKGGSGAGKYPPGDLYGKSHV